MNSKCDDDVKTILWAGMLFAAAVLLVFLVTSLVYADIYFSHNVRENGFVESAQVFFVALCALIFLYVAKIRKTTRVTMYCLCCMFVCMLIRELDAVFDKLVFHGAWILFVVPVVVCCFAYVRRNLFELISGSADFIRSRSYVLMFVGLLTTLVFSRIVGSKKIWTLIFEDEFLNRAVKNTVEESIELFGYMLMFFSGIRYVLEIRSYKLGRRRDDSAEP